MRWLLFCAFGRSHFHHSLRTWFELAVFSRRDGALKTHVLWWKLIIYLIVASERCSKSEIVSKWSNWNQCPFFASQPLPFFTSVFRFEMKVKKSSLVMIPVQAPVALTTATKFSFSRIREGSPRIVSLVTRRNCLNKTLVTRSVKGRFCATTFCVSSSVVTNPWRLLKWMQALVYAARKQVYWYSPIDTDYCNLVDLIFLQRSQGFRTSCRRPDGFHFGQL